MYETRRSRRFSRFQRSVLHDVAQGCCEECGAPLDDTWEADHIQPSSLGGTTDVINGQALCRRCNRRKGARVMESGQLRQWQQRALVTYEQQKRPRDFLVVATPGSGKTTLAAELAKRLLNDGTVVRVVVVVPTTHLCTQWQQALSIVGIELQIYDNDINPETRDQAGMICTYAQFNERWVQHHRAFCRRPTLVIFDELHHAGEERAWGEALRVAFEPATKRLALSGTPWRNDNNPIPFVFYDDSGVSRANFTYGYADALRDGICRQVFFPIYDGTMEWWSVRSGTRSADWQTMLNRIDESRRLVTALTVSPENQYFRTMLANAHARLLEIRELQADAGGLVIAKDQQHAKQIADELATISGQRPALAISEIKESGAVITHFARSNTPWIVAVKMISEGANIPRLRVEVYATNIVTDMFFRQAIGRVVRVQAGVEDEQSAFVYLPADKRLIDFAEAIKNERDHQLEEEELRTRQSDADALASPDFFVPGAASEGARIGVINDGETIGDHDLQLVEADCRRFGIPFRYAPQLVRWSRERQVATATVAPDSSRPVATLQDQKLAKGGLVEKLARRLAVESGLSFSDVNGLLWTATGAQKKDRTLDQLRRCQDLLQTWHQEVAHGVTRTVGQWKEVARRAR